MGYNHTYNITIIIKYIGNKEEPNSDYFLDGSHAQRDNYETKTNGIIPG
jgi:hypothetical protein